MTIQMNRRTFLTSAGALVVSVSLPGGQARASTSTQASRLGLNPDQLSSYISVNQDGSVVGWVGKVDMGQGTDIGWIKLIAEELDLPTDRVSMVQGHTEMTVDQGGASGSTGVWRAGAALRNAAAEARYALVGMASEKLAGPGRSSHRDRWRDQRQEQSGEEGLLRRAHRRAALRRAARLEQALRQRAPGQGQGEAQITERVQDHRQARHAAPRHRTESARQDGIHGGLEDSRHAARTHDSSAIAGAVPVAVDESSVKGIPGVKVFWQKGFIGVVAPKEWDAIRAAQTLKVTWSDVKAPFPDQKDIYEHIRKAPVTKRNQEVNVGDVDAAFAGAAKIVEATYEWPFHSHAPMAPACGIADVRDGGATVWTGSQKPHHCRDGVALMLGVPVEKVKAISMVGPGSYGRNDAGDSVMDAVVLSRAFGKPVRVQGMRYEGIRWDPKAPASIHKSRAALDKDGKVIAWHFESKAFSRQEFFRDEGAPERTLAGQLLDYPLKPVWLFGPPTESYSFASRRKASETIAPLLERASPLRTSHMRDPSGTQIHFAVESFMDELALATNTDPVAFRLRYLSDARDIALIKAAVDKAGWQPRVGARKQVKGDVLTGQGIGYAVRGATRVADHRGGRSEPQHVEGLGAAFRGRPRLRPGRGAGSAAAGDRSAGRADDQPFAL